ncbi:N-acetylmuramoyl-L-alanine amidase [Psychrosphaera aestuarii]
MRFNTAVSKFIKTIIVICMILVATPSYASDKINGVRIWPAPDSTRVVLDLSGPADFSYFQLSNPQRLVIDLNNTKLATSLNGLAKDAQIITKVRKSTPKRKGSTRLVLDLVKKIEPMLFALPPAGPYGNRLVIDLLDKEEKVEKAKRVIETDRDIVIAIDAGHGGEDPGSIGRAGTFEKHVTLSLAKKIEALINKEKGLKAVLTRTGDYYLDLNKRTKKARESGAELLISVHADAFTTPGPHGASVWVQSNKRATTEVGRSLERKEEHSQLLGGVAEAIKDTTTEEYLMRTFIDLSMDHSRDQGFTVAYAVLDELKKVTSLHQRKPQSASLGVLKSPDIPSILVEGGFISNPKEEKMLTNAWQQNRLANAIVNAVKKHFKKRPPEGTLYAKLHRSVQHKVRPGESLSLVAQNYKVSVSSLKSANSLKNDVIRVGQVLSIPQS